MKKFLFSLMALLAIAGTSTAQTENALTVADIELPQNYEAQLIVSYQFDDVNYTGYQFNLRLPDDLEFVLDETTDDETDVANTNYQTTLGVTANLSEGLVKVGGLSYPPKPLPEVSGTLLSFTIKPKTTSLEIGKTYTGYIEDIIIVPMEGEKKTLANSTFTITIGEPDDGRMKFYETSATLPPKFVAGEKANVTMFRSIKGGQWNTIVLPFTLTKDKAEAAFGTDVQLKEFSGFDTQYTDDEDVTPDAITISFSTYAMTNRKGMTGGKPFLIKTSKDIESFQADEVTLVGAVTATEKEDADHIKGKMTGSLVKSVIPADGLFINNEKFWYSKGNTNVKAFRCWFELGAVLDKETDFGAPVYFSFDDETTGIKNVQRTVNDGAYYNLSGQRVENPAKGLYIKNGKKVIVK